MISGWLKLLLFSRITSGMRASHPRPPCYWAYWWSITSWATVEQQRDFHLRKDVLRKLARARCKPDASIRYSKWWRLTWSRQSNLPSTVSSLLLLVLSRSLSCFQAKVRVSVYSSNWKVYKLTRMLEPLMINESRPDSRHAGTNMECTGPTPLQVPDRLDWRIQDDFQFPNGQRPWLWSLKLNS